MKNIDWVGVMIWGGLFLMIILFAGSPDLMDAIIHSLMN